MELLDSQTLTSLALLVSAIATLIWNIRRKP